MKKFWKDFWEKWEIPIVFLVCLMLGVLFTLVYGPIV